MRAEDAVLSVHLLLQVVKSDTLDAPEGSFGWFRGWKESKSEAFQFELDDATSTLSALSSTTLNNHLSTLSLLSSLQQSFSSVVGPKYYKEFYYSSICVSSSTAKRRC